jgi:hypothetical protein
MDIVSQLSGETRSTSRDRYRGFLLGIRTSSPVSSVSVLPPCPPVSARWACRLIRPGSGEIANRVVATHKRSPLSRGFATRSDRSLTIVKLPQESV